MTHRSTRRTFLRQSAVTFGAAWGGVVPCSRRGATAAEVGPGNRFAICNETFGDWPFEKACAVAAECGYEGLEIAPFTISDYVTDIPSARRRELRRQAEAAGLQVVGLHWLLARTQGFHLTSPDRGVRQQTVQYLGALAEFCADLGGQMLVFGSPKQRNLADGVSREQGLKWASEVIRQTLPALEKQNVRLAMEPLSPRTTNFLRTASEAVQLIRMVNSPRCRLILDCNAMASEGVPPAGLIRKFRSDLVHFHANDPNGQGPGFGELDFVPILGALREVKFPGWISVEVFNYEAGARRLARESIDYMKRCIAKLG